MKIAVNTYGEPLPTEVQLMIARNYRERCKQAYKNLKRAGYHSDARTALEMALEETRFIFALSQ